MRHYTKIWAEYVTILLLIHTSFKYTMTILVRPYWDKGGTNDVSLDIWPQKRKSVVFYPSHFFYDYKNAALRNSLVVHGLGCDTFTAWACFRSLVQEASGYSQKKKKVGSPLCSQGCSPLPACISHKYPTLINSLFACYFASGWILSVPELFCIKTKEPADQAPGVRFELKDCEECGFTIMRRM